MDAQVKISPSEGLAEILTTARLHAHRAIIYRTMFDPELNPKRRYTQHDDETGREFAFTGIYHSLSMDKTTLLTEQSVFQSLQDRDGMLANGMESGAIELYNRLNTLVNKEKYT